MRLFLLELQREGRGRGSDRLNKGFSGTVPEESELGTLFGSVLWVTLALLERPLRYMVVYHQLEFRCLTPSPKDKCSR